MLVFVDLGIFQRAWHTVDASCLKLNFPEADPEKGFQFPKGVLPGDVRGTGEAGGERKRPISVQRTPAFCPTWGTLE